MNKSLFELNSVYLQEIVIDTEINPIFWNYDPINANLANSAGTYDFETIYAQFPRDSGSYAKNIKFMQVVIYFVTIQLSVFSNQLLTIIIY